MVSEKMNFRTERDEYKTTRIMYILEAAFEYFIVLAMGSTYIARITAYVGISDELTAIISSFLSLGNTIQIFALLIAHIRPVKKWITGIHIASQCLFTFVYIIPILPLSITGKTILLFITIILAFFMHYVINSPKLNWYMSLVDDKKRGDFTAIKEIVSLISSCVFIYLIGLVLDITNKKTAFLIMGVILFVIMVLHTVTLVFSKEKPAENVSKLNVAETLKKLFKNKAFIKVVIVFCVWAFINNGVINFLGSYQAKELGFSASLSSIIIVIASIFRAVISRPMGKIGDKKSFTKLVILAFAIEIASLTCLVFTVPSNGKILYTLHAVLLQMGLAGLSNSEINLTYAVVDKEDRTAAYAIIATAMGITGFVTTLILSPVMSIIQGNGNTIFGLNLYAQQFFAAVSVVLLIITVTWLVLNLHKNHKDEIS